MQINEEKMKHELYDKICSDILTVLNGPAQLDNKVVVKMTGLTEKEQLFTFQMLSYLRMLAPHAKIIIVGNPLLKIKYFKKLKTISVRPFSFHPCNYDMNLWFDGIIEKNGLNSRIFEEIYEEYYEKGE